MKMSLNRQRHFFISNDSFKDNFQLALMTTADNSMMALALTISQRMAPVIALMMALKTTANNLTMTTANNLTMSLANLMAQTKARMALVIVPMVNKNR